MDWQHMGIELAICIPTCFICCEILHWLVGKIRGRK